MREATPEEVADALAYALRHERGKGTRRADAMLAQIVAQHLVEHLRMAGFVLMKKPPAPAHGGPG